MNKKTQKHKSTIIYCNICESEILGEHIVSKTARRTEKHICQKCFKQMQETGGERE